MKRPDGSRMRGKMTEGWFWLLAVGTMAAMAGFWSGRFSVFVWVPEEGEPVRAGQDTEHVVSSDGAAESGRCSESKDTRGAVGGRRSDCSAMGSGSLPAGGCISRQEWMRHRKRRHRGNDEKIPIGWAVGSPGEGAVLPFHGEGRRGALVRTTDGRLYAPASGKIVKMYPSGSQMILRTDFGVELLIRVGGTNEMTGEYFRPRVLQNEIVGKGKLLLEYDRAALLAAGEDVDILLSVEEAGDFRDITVTGKTQAKIGEEILWIRERFGAYSEL